MFNFLRKKKKYFVSREGLRSASDNGGYIAFVEKTLTDQKLFSDFKKSTTYQEILEHTSEEQAREYLKVIADQTPEFMKDLKRFSINDLIGGANVVEFTEDCKLSPSTLRYVKVASDLVHLFGADLNGARVAEIGVGYGGQRLILDQVYRFHCYEMFDLPPVLALVSKYLEAHLLESSYATKTLNTHTGDQDYDLVISNYAFSELPAVVQRKYMEKVLKKSTRGYLTMNSGVSGGLYSEGRMTLEEIQYFIPSSKVIEEKPYTYNGNYILVWK